MLESLIAMITIDNIVTAIITIGFAVGLVYMFFKETGLESKLQRIKKLQIEQTNSGWGVEELKKLTEMQIGGLLKLSEKVNKNVLLGIRPIGKAKIRIRITPELYVYEISKGFLGLGKKLYFIINDKEVSHIDKNNIFLKDDIINNKAGIYYLIGENQTDLKVKTTFVNSVINKMNNEDIAGRISNLATKLSYLDIIHAQQSDLLMKRIEAMNKQVEGGGSNVSTMDFLSA